MKPLLKIVLLATFVLAAVAAYFLYFRSPDVQQASRQETRIPSVSVSPAKAQDMHIPVYTRGTVTPSTQIHLVSEVSGQILEISPNFANGGFFKKGEVLVRVNPLEYDVAIKRAEASQAQARQAFLQAQAEKKARSMGRSVHGNALASFELQARQAEAHYLAAKAEVDAIRTQRDRTTIRAPFDGRVLVAGLNVGQYLHPGAQMGVIYAVDVAEVRLPLSDRQLALVDVPTRMSESEQKDLPDVIFTEEFAGKTFTWKGKVVRAEGGVDERNRLLYVIAHVPDPYGVDPQQPGRPELVAGSFVEAKIAGRRFDRIYAIPRKALRNGKQVWVVGDDSRLSRRELAIVHKAKDSVFVSSGLDDGDQVVLNQLDIAVEGMRVRPQLEEIPRDEESATDTGENPFASSKPVQSAVSAPFQNARSSRPETVTLSEDKARALAGKAKDYYDQLDDKQKEKLKQNVTSLARQLGALQGKTTQPAVQPAAESPASSPAPTAPPAMSPLAAEFEQDMQREQPAEPSPVTAEPEKTPQPTAIAPAEEPAPAPAKTDQVASAAQPEPAAVPAKPARPGVIATVAAPKPLEESTQ